jgi:hypothetical protein
MLDSTRMPDAHVLAGTRRRAALDLRWPATAAGLGLALAAGVLAHMRIADAARADLLDIAMVGVVLAAAIATAVSTAVRDAAELWETRRELAVARADAAAADRQADLCSAAELRSRRLLQELQVATLDAFRDPFLADRLARDPRRERTLTALLDDIDRHLERRPAAA